MWAYNEHQIAGAEWALDCVRKRGFAYLCWQERTRKTGTALLAVENSSAQSCLVVTKKKAIDGWARHIVNLPLTKDYSIINYESIHKVTGSYDIIILDESHHAISKTGRPSKTWRILSKLTKGKAIIYLSATPYAEHLGLIYHQLKLSDWTPFKFKNFYDFFRRYGVSSMTRTPYGLVETYTKYKDDEILNILEPYFDFKTRKEVGIEHEPVANVVVVPLLDSTKKVIKQTIYDSVFTMGTKEIPLDSPMKLRMAHYQLEGGTIKTEDGAIFTTSGREKIDYIMANYDLPNTAIMAHFIAERQLLEGTFPEAMILSSDGHAEGVDLSHMDKLVIYSMSFKTSKYTQRLARQANHDRRKPIEVDILVADKPGIGFEVYKAVAIKKENFDRHSYERSTNDRD